jgi:hypothetical protein
MPSSSKHTRDAEEAVRMKLVDDGLPDETAKVLATHAVAAARPAIREGMAADLRGGGARQAAALEIHKGSPYAAVDWENQPKANQRRMEATARDAVNAAIAEAEGEAA